jgi:hypothetical protein
MKFRACIIYGALVSIGLVLIIAVTSVFCDRAQPDRELLNVRSQREQSPAHAAFPRWSVHTGVRSNAAPPQNTAGATLHVAVRDDLGAAVEDARVTARAGDDVLFAATNGAGEAEIAMNGGGHVLVHAEAEGLDDVSAEAELGDGGGRVDIVMQRSSSLRGRVLGYDGQPQDLAVVAEVADAPGTLRTAPVSASGEFFIPALPAGTYLVGFQPAAFDAQQVEIRLAPGERGTVELALAPRGAVDVTALFPSGSAAARDATVRLVRGEDGAEITRPLRLRSGAPQRLEAIPVGRYGVELAVGGLAHVPSQMVEVGSSDPAALTFRWPEGRISGRVTTGSAADAGVAVSAYKIVNGADDREVRDNNPEHRTISQGDGSYALVGLDAGRYVVVAERGALSTSVPLELGSGEDRTLALALENGRTVIAEVRYRGAAVEGARVLATSTPYAENARSAETDARGLAELPHLTGRTYLIRAVWMEGEEAALREARADLDLTRDDGFVELEVQ